MSSQDRSRQPAGVPTGGQFAAESRSEVDVDLDDGSDVPSDVACGFYEPDDLYSKPVAYQWESELYSPDGLVEAMIGKGRAAPAARDMSVEDVLDQIAGAEAIDREDEYSFDSDDFPKAVTHDQMMADQTLELIGSDGATPVLYGEPWIESMDIGRGQEGAEEALLFQATDDEGNPVDSIEIDDDSLDTMNEQFEDFAETNAVLVKRAYAAGVEPADLGRLWVYSRNGHGTGLWDAQLGSLGDRLHKAAQGQGPLDTYVGDDGRLHIG